MDHLPDAKIQVVAVCGNEARIYSAVSLGRRFFVRKETFPNPGAAKLFAQEYEDEQRKSRNSRV